MVVTTLSPSTDGASTLTPLAPLSPTADLLGRGAIGERGELILLRGWGKRSFPHPLRDFSPPPGACAQGDGFAHSAEGAGVGVRRRIFAIKEAR